MSSRQIYSGETDRSAGHDKYSATEVIRFQEMFRPIADQHRQRKRIAMAALGAGTGILLCSLLANRVSQLFFDKVLFEKATPWYVDASLLACFVVFAVAMISRPRLKCPACRESMDQALRCYCPECGSKSLDAGWLGTSCQSCGKSLRRGRFNMRLYQVRACTGCGLMLDDRGL